MAMLPSPDKIFQPSKESVLLILRGDDHRLETVLQGEDEEMEENMTPEEAQFAEENHIYEMYSPFFTGLYNEFRQQTRKRADEEVNAYKAESINKVLRPLKKMMEKEEYAEMLGLIDPGKDGEAGMSFSDAMILMTQYKSALAKFHRNHL